MLFPNRIESKPILRLSAASRWMGMAAPVLLKVTVKKGKREKKWHDGFLQEYGKEIIKIIRHGEKKFLLATIACGIVSILLSGYEVGGAQKECLRRFTITWNENMPLVFTQVLDRNKIKPIRAISNLHITQLLKALWVFRWHKLLYNSFMTQYKKQEI